MKIERTKNTVSGFVWGAGGKIVNTLLPFLLRTVIIYKLGVEYLGLSSLFASILQVLSLSELGFSYACVYAMYKPIAEDDYSMVGAILKYLKKIYRIIGIVVISLGILFVPFLKFTIKDDVPADTNIYILYFIYLANSALSYFFFAYKTSLLSALQRNDQISQVGLITNTALRVAQCAMLFIYPNYYVYVILIPISTLANNLIKAWIVNKKYSIYLKAGNMPAEVKQDIKSRIVPLLGIKISVVLINAADTLVISAFLGLFETALYNNYFFLMTSVQSILGEVYSSMYGGVGNSVIIDSKDELYGKFKRLTFLNSWLTIVCTACFICLYQPFMTVWVGEGKLLPDGMMYLFCAYFFGSMINKMIIVYKDAAGIWKEDMLRCYIACGTNIVLNLILVNFIGLYGVIGSSVFVALVIDPLMARLVFKKVFDKPAKYYYGYLVKDVIVCIAVCAVFALICNNIMGGVLGLVLRGMICVVGVNAVLFLVYFKDKRYAPAKDWAVGVVKRLIKRK